MSSAVLDILNPDDVELYCGRYLARLVHAEARTWFSRNLRNHLVRAADFHAEIWTRGELIQVVFEGTVRRPPDWALAALDKGRPVHLFACSQPSHADLFVHLAEGLELAVAWLNGLGPGSQELRSLSRMGVPDLLSRAARARSRRLPPGGDTQLQEPAGERIDLGDGWSAVELNSAGAVTLEGAAMRHCAADYAHLVGREDGRLRLFSLRDECQRPRLTVEILRGPRGRLSARQIRGVANSIPSVSLAPRVRALLDWAGVEDPGPDGQRLGIAGIDGRLFSCPAEVLEAQFSRLPAEDWGYLDRKGWSRQVLRCLLDWRDRLSDCERQRAFDMFTPRDPARIVADQAATAELRGTGFSAANLFLPDALWVMDAEGLWNGEMRQQLTHQRVRVMRAVVERLRSHPDVLHRIWIGPVRDPAALRTWTGTDAMGRRFGEELARLRRHKLARISVMAAAPGETGGRGAIEGWSRQLYEGSAH